VSKLETVQRAGKEHLIACGRHENRYGEDAQVWDLTCEHCLDNLQRVYAELKVR